MKTSRTACALLCLMASALAWAQTDTGQAPDESQRNTPPAAFGQETPAVGGNENPPIAGLAQPSLEPHIQPRRMLLGGVKPSEPLHSNLGSAAPPARHTVTGGRG